MAARLPGACRALPPDTLRAHAPGLGRGLATSQIAHTSKWDELWALEPIYGAPRPQYAPEAYCRVYERHLEEVRRLFASTGRLLGVCWETGSGWAELCPFLGVPVPEGVPFPHSNASASRSSGAPR